MRAQPYGNIQDDLPRCYFCRNSRGVKGALCTLAIVLVVAYAALSTSGYLSTLEEYYLEKLGAYTSPNSAELRDRRFSEEVESFKAVLRGLDNPSDALQSLQRMIKKVVRNELLVYDSDKTGMTDFALENIGGCIASTRDTKTYTDGSAAITIFGIPIVSFASSPKTILQPSTMPGDCWAIEGDRGRVVIKLMTDIIVTALTLEHISRDLSPTGDISSAPMNVALYGLTCLDDDMPHNFGTFTYSQTGPTVQIFQVKHPTHRPYGLVELYVKSNHGNKLFTCIYRVRVHGNLPDVDRDEL